MAGRPFFLSLFCVSCEWVTALCSIVLSLGCLYSYNLSCQVKGQVYLLILEKIWGSLNSLFLSCNASHFVCRYHLAFTLLLWNYSSGTKIKIVVLWLLLLLLEINYPLSLVQKSCLLTESIKLWKLTFSLNAGEYLIFQFLTQIIHN